MPGAGLTDLLGSGSVVDSVVFVVVGVGVLVAGFVLGAFDGLAEGAVDEGATVRRGG
ncbi:hypothetical protein ACTI_15200 [Actinoplanes sp. OR16]|nr:hypothetical protein ACTI_15200 [Actinoplanes sp. OR16]